ncbi:unnamed protein product [Gongylonema pulchrum]|uniref:Uncharacterized protein n=1 Tax=Gongylonema pulchrum TaxID=637853 RepID=A0A183E4Q0_9BILA|nr:unnamed protein product [Gongylonema pulchrum]
MNVLQGGPKPKELPQVLPTVEFKTTPSGGKYKKIDYEVIDASKSMSSDEREEESYRSVSIKNTFAPKFT